MTEEELTNWEHSSDVIKVLTSYEMGAWLHRRDKRLLQEIRAEIEEAIDSYVCDVEENTPKAQGMINAKIMALNIIDKYREDGET